MAKDTKIPTSVKQLHLSEKQFAKKNDIKLKGHNKKAKKSAKKDLEIQYATEMIEGLNMAVKILAENKIGEKKIEKVKLGVENIILQPRVMKRISKIYSNDKDQYPHLVYLPYMIVNTIVYYSQENIDEKEKEFAEQLNEDELIEFCEKILKSPIKKYKSAGLSQEVAFQIATVIPTTKILKNRIWYRNLIQCMYSCAENNAIGIIDVLDGVLSVGKKHLKKSELLEGFYSAVIITKTSNVKYTDTQKDLHEEIIASTLVYLDSMKHNKLKELLKKYIKHRKLAEQYKNDRKRIIKFIDHANSNSKYTTIKSVVLELVADNGSNELYLS